MYYIEVQMCGGETFKYITGKERDAKFIKTLADSYSRVISQINIINLYGKENENNE